MPSLPPQLPRTQRPPAPSDLHLLLQRPPEQRLREYQYRCAQAIVFGLPVLALHLFGHRLGGAEAARWSAVLQALLAGWVVWVGAAGMLFEGILLLRERITPDLLVAAIAAMLYLLSLISALILIAGGERGFVPPMFHACVTLVALWTGMQWFRLRGQPPPSPPPSRIDK